MDIYQILIKHNRAWSPLEIAVFSVILPAYASGKRSGVQW